MIRHVQRVTLRLFPNPILSQSEIYNLKIPQWPCELQPEFFVVLIEKGKIGDKIQQR